MERRTILLGTGTLFATTLAGCAGISSDPTGESLDDIESGNQENNDESTDKQDTAEGNNKDEKEPDHDDEKKEQQDIPGFDRDNFEIDSEVIQVKELTYRKHKLHIRVMLTTTDRDVLAEELRTLAPEFGRAIRDADIEEFFTEVESIQFTLYDENKNRRLAFFLDIRWLREFLDDEITNDEFVDQLLDQIAQV